MTSQRYGRPVWTHWYLQKSQTLNVFYELTTGNILHVKHTFTGQYIEEKFLLQLVLPKTLY